MSKFEKRFGKYAISNLSLILILCYVVGYFIELVNGFPFVSDTESICDPARADMENIYMDHYTAVFT